MLSTTVTPNEVGNSIEILFTAGAYVDNNSDRVMTFQLFVDGVFKRATHIFSDKGSSMRAGSCALAYVHKVASKDPHVIEIRWGHNSSGTAKIDAVSEPEYNHGSLIVTEVRA